MSLILWLLIIICVEAITEIIVDSEIMFSTRRFLGYYEFLGKLVNCGYCMSVWVAVALVWALPSVFEMMFLDMVVKVFVVHRLSNWWHELTKRWLDRHPLTLVIHKIGDSNEKRRK